MTSLKTLINSQHPCLLLENTRTENTAKSAMVFTDPVFEVSAHNGKELQLAFAEIDRLRLAGYYLAGYIQYEAAYYIIEKLDKLADKKNTDPLLVFYAFNKPICFSSDEVDAALESNVERAPYINNFQVDESREQYLLNLQKIKQYIYEGDTYQVNHTLRMNFDLNGDLAGLYRTLRKRQRVAFSAWLQFPERDILSLSPELFIEKKHKTLTSKPMKGTAARGQNHQEDEQILQSMAVDEKQLSENLMIVDLMRNDVGRLAIPGSMQVDKLFQIQKYETLFQMISTVSGEVDKNICFAEVIEGLYPCGSITGAPKIRTMEIIHELESSKRGIYTGAIGYITPANDFSFSVPIRTIEFEKQSNRGVLGIGGGIIHESIAEDEWRECMLKANFLTGINSDFSLIETCYFCGKNLKPERLNLHLQRLENSAKYFKFPFDRDAIMHRLKELINTLDRNLEYKIRLLLASDGSLSANAEHILPPADSKPVVCISSKRIQSDSVYRQHKTTRRELYNQEYNRVSQNQFYDILFLNEKNVVAEASRHNVFIELDKTWVTPPVSSGALPGIMRQCLLNDAKSKISVMEITIQDLQSADKVYLCNSVRGLVEVSVKF